jgi:putative endonuclease
MYKVMYLYIVECSDKSYYVGVSSNLDNRIEQHNLGINKTAYTYPRRPVKLVWHEIFNDFNLAFEEETKLKKWSRAKKEALIKGDFELLKVLAKKDFSKKKAEE